MTKKIGILGGTFDPVHLAHLELAQVALENHDLDVILFIPTGQPVRKLGTTHASSQDRLHMLEIACEGIPSFEVSSIEVDRPEITFTIDTLRALKTLYGEGCELFLILGEDTVTDLPTWKESEQIAALTTVLYARRPAEESSHILPDGFDCHELSMPAMDISSSLIRDALFKGEDVSELVPSGALAYIKEHKLYDKPEQTF